MIKNFIFPDPKKNIPMKISALYFLYNQEFWNIQFPRKKHWVNPNCQNSEPTKRTVSIWAIVSKISDQCMIRDFYERKKFAAYIFVIVSLDMPFGVKCCRCLTKNSYRHITYPRSF